jgi:hypothetical protein
MAKISALFIALLLFSLAQTVKAAEDDSIIRLSWGKAKFSKNGQYVNFVLKNGIPKEFVNGVICVKAGKETLKGLSPNALSGRIFTILRKFFKKFFR